MKRYILSLSLVIIISLFIIIAEYSNNPILLILAFIILNLSCILEIYFSVKSTLNTPKETFN